MLEFRMEGFDELLGELKRLEQNAREFDGEHKVPILELCDEKFMREHTRFGSLEEMIRASGVSEEEFVAADDDQRDEWVRSTTSFTSWDDLIGKASVEWSVKKIFG